MKMKTERRQCVSCGGSGHRECRVCNGTGRRRSIGVVFPDRSVAYEPCSFCNGKGKQPCSFCHGQGYTETLVPDFEPLKPDVPFQVRDLGVNIPTETLWSQPNDTIRTKSTTVFSRSSITDSSVILVLVALVILSITSGIAVFGFKETLVAAEGFFIFAGWSGLRAAHLFRKQESEKLEAFRVYMAVGFGLCAGLLAAYLLLTTPEGQTLNEWITAQTIRLVGSLFASVSIPVLLELALRRIFG